MTGEWRQLGGISSQRLTMALRALHWAAQPAAAVGKLLLPHQPHYAELSFTWSAAAGALVQGEVAAATPFAAALRLATPALLLLERGGRTAGELPLAGHTLAEAFGWLEEELCRRLGRPLPERLERPGELGPHTFGDGAPFDAADGEAFAAAGDLYGNAHASLTAWAAAVPGAGPVRCWPHHFDIATLVALDSPVASAAAAAEPRTLGLGLSPGDDILPGPYFYVTPWPYPPATCLPALPLGAAWHTEGWVGAVLGGASFMNPAATAAEQTATVARFLKAAGAACRRLLGA